MILCMIQFDTLRVSHHDHHQGLDVSNAGPVVRTPIVLPESKPVVGFAKETDFAVRVVIEVIVKILGVCRGWKKKDGGEVGCLECLLYKLPNLAVKQRVDIGDFPGPILGESRVLYGVVSRKKVVAV